MQAVESPEYSIVEIFFLPLPSMFNLVSAFRSHYSTLLSEKYNIFTFEINLPSLTQCSSSGAAY